MFGSLFIYDKTNEATSIVSNILGIFMAIQIAILEAASLSLPKLWSRISIVNPNLQGNHSFSSFMEGVFFHGDLSLMKGQDNTISNIIGNNGSQSCIL